MFKIVAAWPLKVLDFEINRTARHRTGQDTCCAPGLSQSPILGCQNRAPNCCCCCC